MRFSMSEKKHYYITTPIYYVNDKPHVGHFYCTVMADVCARYHRLIGEDVLFVTGTDENSQKILPVAEREGIPLRQYVDRMATRWYTTWKELGLTFDKFIRTTSVEHRKTVEKFFQQSLNKGDIYKKKYEGLYCVGCEKFLKDSDLIDGVCPDHKIKPQIIEEENYFFRLSSYQNELLHLLESGYFALPEFRCNEMIQFVKNGLEDVSISRSSVKWGIPLPTDQDHVFYVWYDALINYLTALDYHKEQSELLNDYWKHAVHLVGKDIFRFHTIMWPAMLLSAGLPPPRNVFGHGFFTVNGQKIGKSLGNAIDPIELVKKYGSDTLRFYILSDIPFGKDSDFSMERLESQYNSFLANSYGNIVNRILNMITRYTDGYVIPTKQTSLFEPLRNDIAHLVKEVPLMFDSFRFDDLVKKVFTVISACNKLIDDMKPWEMAKGNNRENLEELLFTLYEVIRIATIILHPLMPKKTEEVLHQMGVSEGVTGILYEKAVVFGFTKEKIRIGNISPIFPRIEFKGAYPMEKTPVVVQPQSNIMTSSQTVSVQNETGTNLITIDDFKKVELVVGCIQNAERIEGADKLLKLTIDIGTEIRTVCAGIAQFYSPDELLNKNIIIVKNLAPRKLRGIMSQGMILAAKDGDKLSLLSLDRSVKPGSSVS